MTVNDLRLNKATREVHRASSRLDYLTREAQWGELCWEWWNILKASLKGVCRVIYLRLTKRDGV